MQAKTQSKELILSKAELLKRRHDHADTATSDWANQFKTGVLDVELHRAAGIGVPPSLDECHVVRVQYAGTTRNFESRKDETLFSTWDSMGNFIGHYFSPAFTSLMR